VGESSSLRSMRSADLGVRDSESRGWVSLEYARLQRSAQTTMSSGRASISSAPGRNACGMPAASSAAHTSALLLFSKDGLCAWCC
jgi:hypothetical protein